MPQITKTDYDWLKSHKEHIIRRNRYLRYFATFLIWLGISIGNYYFLASFTSITWSISILLLQFEIIFSIGIYYILCKLTYRKSDSFAAAVLALSFTLTLAVAISDSEEVKQ